MNGTIRRAKVDARIKEVGLLYDELTFQTRSMWPDGRLNVQMLRQIEQLVLSMEEDDSPPFAFKWRPSGEAQCWMSHVGNELLKIFHWIPPQLPAGIHFSERVYIFHRRYCEMKGDFPGTCQYFGGCLQSPLKPQQGKWFNSFASVVKAHLRDVKVKGAIRSAESSAEKRYQDACAYFDSLFLKAPDLLLITMEFSMAPTLARASGSVPDEVIDLPGRGGVKRQQLRVVANLQEMLAKGRHRKAFSTMVGFMGRWSRSEEKGTFARVVFFLDGSKVADGFEVTAAIGNEWVSKYSVGYGKYEISYLSRAESEDSLFPVRISRADIKQRRAVKQSVILYMTKLGLVYQDPALQVRSQFFRGELPSKKPSSSRGKTSVSL